MFSDKIIQSLDESGILKLPFEGKKKKKTIRLVRLIYEYDNKNCFGPNKIFTIHGLEVHGFFAMDTWSRGSWFLCNGSFLFGKQ